MYLQFAMLQGAIAHCMELDRKWKQRREDTCANDIRQNAVNRDLLNKSPDYFSNPKQLQTS